MEEEVEFISQSNTNLHVKRLDNFLSVGKFQTPKNSKYTNIINQGKKDGHYFVPFSNESVPMHNISFDALDLTNDISNKTILEEHLLEVGGRSNASYTTPIEEFFDLLEECRLQGLVLRYCEQQTFNIPVKKKCLKPIPSNVFSNEDITEITGEVEDDLEDLDNLLDNEPEKVVMSDMIKNLSDDISVDSSCIELDFDVYQREPTRIINNMHFYTLIFGISGIIAEHLDFGNVEHPAGIIEKNGISTMVRFHAAVLHKPDVVETTHKKYGKCWKDSFHIRFFIKVTKDYKKYLINVINERGLLANSFGNLPIINPFTEVLDSNSSRYPAMLLGSMKNSGKVPHFFDKLYRVDLGNWPTIAPLLTVLSDFDSLPTDAKPVKIPDPRDKRRRILKSPIPKYKYNLCYELSLNYEALGGLIKKRRVSPKEEVLSFIQSHTERSNSNLISNDELEETRMHVTDLTVRDYQAKYTQKILDILKPERVMDYGMWKSIIIILARENPDYKPLAIYFSQRCPLSWAKGGLSQLDNIWEWAISHPIAPANKDGKEDEVASYRSIGTLFAWAKEDNPVKYRELQEFNAFTKLQKMSFEFSGRLHETHFAEILKIMYGDVFIVDESEFSTSKGRDRRWYEFVFPENQTHDSGSSYKWRWEKYPDNLDKYISKKLPTYLKTIREWVQEKCESNVSEENTQKYYINIKKNLEDSESSLGKDVTIKHVISRCEIEFRRRGFLENLDKEPNFIGVGNGVLKLYPKTEMIQRFHEIPISRSTRVPYIREKIDMYDSEWSTNHPNPYIKHLFTEITRLFCGETDAFIFTMCYLSSSVDARKKNPLFFIWLGPGSNGKSFLLELHIKSLHEVVRGGYAAKMNAAYFVKETKSSGPDSEKMMLKYARFSYCSESQEGDILQMGKIKEFTSETLSGNEKHQTQDMFEANCHFVFCTNHDPRITGRDYGTWRRIIVYRFKMKFVDNPEKDNPYEYKCDVKLVEEIPYDANYKQAYFSILMYFYEMYRDKFQCNLSKIPKPTIDYETQNYKDEQDIIERYITQQVIKIGEFYPGGENRVTNVSLSDLATKYIEWHRRKIGDIDISVKDIIKAFPQTRLKKYITKIHNDDYLTQHRILNMGELPEEYLEKKEEKPAIFDKKDLFDFVHDREDNIISTVDLIDDLDD